jgi:hypothetical protein
MAHRDPDRWAFSLGGARGEQGGGETPSPYEWLLGVAAEEAFASVRGYLRWKLGKSMALTKDVKYSTVGFTVHAWTTTAGGNVTVERKGLFLRLRVLNPSRRDAPRDIGVTVVSVGRCKSGATTFTRIRREEYPKPLLWSYTKLPDKPGTTTFLSLPESERFVDLAVVHDPALISGRVEMVILTEPEPRDRSDRFPPGDYRFGLVLTASNRPPVEVTADVVLLDNWSERDADKVVLYTLHDGPPEFNS